MDGVALEKKLSEMKRDEILNEMIELGEATLLNENKIWTINPDKLVNSFAYTLAEDETTILRAPFTWGKYDDNSFEWIESNLQQFEQDLREGLKDDSLEELRTALFNIRHSRKLYSKINAERLRLKLVNSITNFDPTMLDDIAREMKNTFKEEH